MKNIVQVIEEETSAFRENVAIIEDERRITYQELLETVDGISADLDQMGVTSGRRVAFLCNDCTEYIMISLAVLSLGAAIVPISPSLAGKELDDVLEKIDVHFLIFDRSVHTDETAFSLNCNSFNKIQFGVKIRSALENLPTEYEDVNAAFIRFSSGTTGASKGVVLSHESIVERTDAADAVLKITPDDVIVWLLSMSFHFVVTILLFLRRGATIVICTGMFPESFQKALSHHGGTFTYASPFHYQVLSAAKHASPDLMKRVRMAVCTAMKLPEEAAQKFHEKFGVPLIEAYGIIEVGLPFINQSQSSNPHHGSVGTILPDYEMKIASPNSEGIGEVCLCGKGMLDAYFSPWQTREKILTDGWFKTGDMGRVDADGFLYIVGREKTVINFSGMKIFPDEVEAVLLQHPLIKEALVYGESHHQYGQLPCAKVVLKNEAKDQFDPNEIRSFCYQYLPTYKVPKQYTLVAVLKRTASGKLQRW